MTPDAADFSDTIELIKERGAKQAILNEVASRIDKVKAIMNSSGGTSQDSLNRIAIILAEALDYLNSIRK